MQDRAGRHHLGIKQRMARQLTMEERQCRSVQSIMGATEKRRAALVAVMLIAVRWRRLAPGASRLAVQHVRGEAGVIRSARPPCPRITKRAAMPRSTAKAYPPSDPSADNAVASASARIQERSNTVTDASVSEIGQPVRGSMVCEKMRPSALIKRCASPEVATDSPCKATIVSPAIPRQGPAPPTRATDPAWCRCHAIRRRSRPGGREATPRKRIRHQVDCKAFRDRGQIELHATRLHNGTPAGVHDNASPSGPAVFASNPVLVRKFAAPPRRSETPKLGQPADGRIIGTMGVAREIERMRQNREEFVWQDVPAARLGAG